MKNWLSALVQGVGTLSRSERQSASSVSWLPSSIPSDTFQSSKQSNNSFKPDHIRPSHSHVGPDPNTHLSSRRQSIVPPLDLSRKCFRLLQQCGLPSSRRGRAFQAWHSVSRRYLEVCTVVRRCGYKWCKRIRVMTSCSTGCRESQL